MTDTDRRAEHLGWIEAAVRAANPDLPRLALCAQSLSLLVMFVTLRVKSRFFAGRVCASTFPALISGSCGRLA